jgi:hypothetical protein
MRPSGSGVMLWHMRSAGANPVSSTAGSCTHLQQQQQLHNIKPHIQQSRSCRAWLKLPFACFFCWVQVQRPNVSESILCAAHHTAHEQLLMQSLQQRSKSVLT